MAPPIYLVDVNLPRLFSYFSSDLFIHVVDIDPKMKDTDLWQYALKRNLTILTKDADFYNLALFNTDCPKVVYFQTGNQTLKQLHTYFEFNWKTIVEQLEKATFIIAKKSKIEIVF